MTEKIWNIENDHIVWNVEDGQCHFDDIENAIALLTEVLCNIDENTDLNPFS